MPLPRRFNPGVWRASRIVPENLKGLSLGWTPGLFEWIRELRETCPFLGKENLTLFHCEGKFCGKFEKSLQWVWP
ncbi:MAG: hypothetical protein H5U36_08215 [Candidatus Caldatribacterium sp.]|nr:hypothetical protein [Candidatus Caldatribacterium sp.]